MKLSFIVIDDSELDCFVSRKIIEHIDKTSTVETFLNAQLALETIRDHPIVSPDLKTVILLDLHMPLMNGFQFVEEFEKLPAYIQENYTIVVLSSTRNNNDIFRILNYNTVHSMLEKPLTLEKLHTLILEIQKANN